MGVLFERALRQLAADEAVRAGEPHDPDVYTEPPIQVEAGTVQRLIDEERGGA